MKESKGVYVTKHDIKENQPSRSYQLYASKVTRNYGFGNTREAGVQYNYRRDNVLCTCRYTPGLKKHPEVRYFGGSPKQVYTYHGSRSYTDIGVGSVKAFQKRKVKRIYVPETDDRGVGSSDLSSFISKRTRYYRSSYYDQKKTSSKCVGGMNEGNAEFLNEKLSPIVHTKSGTTSPSVPLSEDLKKNVEIGSNTYEKSFVTISTQVNDDLQKDAVNTAIKVVEVTVEQVKEISKTTPKKSKEVITTVEGKRISKRAQEAERIFSSDSLVQHIHNLENPSEDKECPMSIDLMENKLEREYRKMFCSRSKDSSSKEKKSSEEKADNDMKSTSVLRRRFEALRRGLAKKEDSKRNAVLAAQESSNVSSPSHRDVSIASDPPSLEARSYSNTKTYSPFQSLNQDRIARSSYKKPVTARRDYSRTEEADSEYQSVKGMFKLWGKKFNLDDDECPPGPSVDIYNKSKDSKIPSFESDSKKEGKKFLFFKRRSRDKTKQPYKQKKGVTAGRCEVGDGLMIKIGAANTPPPVVKHEKREKSIVDQIPEEYEEMLRKAWLQQFLAQTIESRNSVKVRWNNNAYATSSSTVFEIMENVYKDTGVVLRSRSEVTTGDSSYYKSVTKQRVNFVQDIEAWMIPKLIPDKARPVPIIMRSDEKGDKNNNIEVTISDQKWIIDKSKAFAHKIEVVLHSNNVAKPPQDPSSQYLRIDIPKGFFSNSCSESSGPVQMSNEEVYKIVEYETPESNSLFKKKNLEFGDHTSKDIKVTVSVKESGDMESKILETVIKRPPIHRDVVVQGSNVYIPKRCNVIGVGIITQKDITKIRKPILKIQDDFTDEDSDPAVHQYHNTSKFAESYLQDYYRHWTPLGMDFFSWCVSDSHLKCCSENSYTTVNQQGDGTKSCPNICDEFLTSAIVSSCGTSCCSQCALWVEEANQKQTKVSKLFSKFKKDSKGKAAPEHPTDKRVLPKDSVEVFKRRKLVNESANRARWSCDDRPYSVPSIESIGAQGTLGDCPRSRQRACYKPASLLKKKVCNKHVSLPNCDTEMPPDPDPYVEKCSPAGILSFKGSSKCDFCNSGKAACAKHATMNPMATCEIPPPKMPCKEPPSRLPACPPSPPTCSPPKRSPSPPQSPPRSPARSPPRSPPRSPARSPAKCGSHPSVHLVAHVSSSQLSATRMANARGGCNPPPCKSNQPQSTPKMSGTKPPSPCPASPPSCEASKRRRPYLCSSSSPTPSCPNNPKHVRTKSKGSSPAPCQARLSPPPSARPASPPCFRPRSASPPQSPPQPASPPMPRCPPKPAAQPRPACPPTPPTPSPPQSPRQPRSPCQPSSPRQPRSPSPPRSPCPPKKRSPQQRCSPQQRRSPRQRSSPPQKPSPPQRLSPPRTPPRPVSPPRIPSSRRPASPPCPPQPQSPQRTPQMSPRRSPICPQKSPSRCPPPPSNEPAGCPPQQPKTKKRPSSPKTCQTPPCKPERPPRPPCTACKKCPSQEFPWPTKNQVSNQPSLNSLCPSAKDSKCKKNCSFLPPSPEPCPRRCNTPPKRSGIFLKMKPSKKTCSKECTAWNSPSGMCPDRGKSEENFGIHLKKGSASTEEIREGMHIKVQDEDGKTLYERVDYQKHRPSLLKDMYDAKMHGVSTSIVQNMSLREQQSGPELQEAKSEVSVANLIEINFKLKVTQGDKTTEINIGNDGVVEKQKTNTKNQIGQTSHEVFMLKDEAEQCTEEANDKNDINIKIVIKNYKPRKKNDGRRYSEDVEDFTQKISDKFHTVSTGYSDVVKDRNFQYKDNTEQSENVEKSEELDETVDAKNVFSVHRTTINLASSNEISKTQITSNEAVSVEEFIERDPIDLMISSRSGTDKSATERTETKTEDFQSKKESDSENKKKHYHDNYYSEKEGPYYSTTDVDDQELPLDLNNISDEPVSDGNNTDVIPSSLTKDEKKRLLKKLFDKACKSQKLKSKGRMKQLKEMFKIILTSDSSDHDDNIPSNELIKEMTYASLKPNYFRDTDSMNNYYNSSVISSSKDLTQNLRYPTKNASQCSVVETDAGSSDDNVETGRACLCSTLAARLKMCEKDVNGVCCCRKQPVNKTDEETCCDLRTDEDFFLLNYKTIEYTDVETQNSKFICNSTNVSVHSKAISGSIKSDDLAPKVEEIININNEIKCLRVKRTFSPHATHLKPCAMKKLNRNTVLGISDEDKVYLLDAKPTKVYMEGESSKETNSKKRSKSKEKIKSRKKKSKFEKPADILQCYETKKAVLEIYTEKTVTNEEERLVAKLPKFVYDKESEIERTYRELAGGSFSAMERNVVMMSINR